MDVFKFRDDLVNEYKEFTRSFTKIRATDIRRMVDESYKNSRFWPDPIIQLNPYFETGGSIDDLVSKGLLDEECSTIFRIRSEENTFGKELMLHKHQAEAIQIAERKESYVLTTGTGSGKSLSYFLPIINDVLRRKKDGDKSDGITAIIVYPMNALCNSQFQELSRFLRPEDSKYNSHGVTFARYTGQETEDDRSRIAKKPPDILLTNYVMLELIMTRFLETDVAVRRHANNLRFLVLDELHTYRGRQGADVSMLVRRVRERFNNNLLCIGTSATMASEGSSSKQREEVADIASKLFGTDVKPKNVIGETIKTVTAANTPMDGKSLRAAIKSKSHEKLHFSELSKHPVAAWVERKLGLEERDGVFVRNSRPLSTIEAAKQLSEACDLEISRCREFLQGFLLDAYQCPNDSGRSFFAFRLHQFVSGAWNAYATLEKPDHRYLTLDGQQFKPGDREKPLYTVSFCRECGQEYIPVWVSYEFGKLKSFRPRELTERSKESDEASFGFIMPDSNSIFDPDNLIAHFPDEWLEIKGGHAQIKPYYRKFKPISIHLNTRGEVDRNGMQAWFIPERFRFCLNKDCITKFSTGSRSDLTKLSGLSTEGRSSATTVLSLSALKHLISTELENNTKKILAFTDNRQDASLQAGHFNDFVQVLRLRSALIAAIRNNPNQKITDETLADAVFRFLQLDLKDYASNPRVKGIKAEDARRVLRYVIGYRLYIDLERGWRITNPNLEQLQILKIDYRGLEECCQDDETWWQASPLLGAMPPEKRKDLARQLLDQMRKGLCIKTNYLFSEEQRRQQDRSFSELKEPWALSCDEPLKSYVYMIPQPRPRGRGHRYRTLHISRYSRFGRKFNSRNTWGVDNPYFQGKFNDPTFEKAMASILTVLCEYGYIEQFELESNLIGYFINSTMLEWTLDNYTDNVSDSSSNQYFNKLYLNTAKLLENTDRFFFQLEAREHTAQVPAEEREAREMMFRKGLARDGLPVLFCSPTMELGVDISSLNTVYMRNVPPTPANYAQRSGRAGRNGQPALVLTYCAARSAHDQYFFSHPTSMVSGIVRPPSIDLANEELIRSHLNSIWLAESGVKLSSSVCEVIELGDAHKLPLIKEISDQTGSTKAETEALKRSKRILRSLERFLTPDEAPWYTESWLPNAVNSAQLRFDHAFDRWRALFRATRSQMDSANQVIHNTLYSNRDHKEAKSLFDEAFKQHELLLNRESKYGTDFYTYRYLAAEGFLPGYNFPRLPLIAYIAGRSNVNKDSFLSRPRFVGLSEFGPRSIIYHEGSTHRVYRAILNPSEDRTEASLGRLQTTKTTLCSNCGYGHFGKNRDLDRCKMCDEPLIEGQTITNLYQIERVSTLRAYRITSDEEERQRQGYDIISTVQFCEDEGVLRFDRVVLENNESPLLELIYSASANLCRINLGWRRRSVDSILGFTIDPNSGEWAKDSNAPTSVEDDDMQEPKSKVRITPYVSDTKNVLIFSPKVGLSQTAMISLQYAIKRGVEHVFHLEDSELAAEPLPSSNQRNTILFYEAGEGGAGVLGRLVRSRQLVAKVARKALEVCHYKSISGNWLAVDDIEECGPKCEAGCYNCLLSYANQLDHSKIDRQNNDMIEFLLQLANCESRPPESKSVTADSYNDMMNGANSSLERAWLKFIYDNGFRLPDRGQPYLPNFNTRPDFAYSDSQTIVYLDGPQHTKPSQMALDRKVCLDLEDAGFTVLRFGSNPNDWFNIISDYAWVFGSGNLSGSRN